MGIETPFNGAMSTISSASDWRVIGLAIRAVLYISKHRGAGMTTGSAVPDVVPLLSGVDPLWQAESLLAVLRVTRDGHTSDIDSSKVKKTALLAKGVDSQVLGDSARLFLRESRDDLFLKWRESSQAGVYKV